jgi:chemotaxis protein methyltransferase CheR
MTESLTTASFDTLAALLKAKSGLIIGKDKIYLLETRLTGILKREKLTDLNKLADRMRAPGSDTLARDVVEAMTTNESFFFRDDKPFVHFRTQALPRLIAARPPGSTIRIWSAASSSGQEAYSLAIIIAEARAQLGDRRVEIIGTDIARDQLARAREGVYTQFEVQRGLPVQMLMRYFKKDEANWRISGALRGMVQFREFNLLSDLRSLGRFDVVFCRNVLIYFDQPTKSRVMDAVAGLFSPDGVLYLGGAETVMGITTKFAPLPSERGVYGLIGPAMAGSAGAGSAAQVSVLHAPGGPASAVLGATSRTPAPYAPASPVAARATGSLGSAKPQAAKPVTARAQFSV